MGVQNDVEMHRLGTMAENRKMLERFLKTGTENEVKSFMDAYFDAIGEQNLQSMMLRQYIVMDTFISVQSLGDSLNIEKEDIERELGDACGKARGAGASLSVQQPVGRHSAECI